MWVVKQGIVPGALKHEATCALCGAVVRFSASEATEVWDRNQRGLKIDCPTEGCSRELWSWD